MESKPIIIISNDVFVKLAFLLLIVAPLLDCLTGMPWPWPWPWPCWLWPCWPWPCWPWPSWPCCRYITVEEGATVEQFVVVDCIISSPIVEILTDLVSSTPVEWTRPSPWATDEWTRPSTGVMVLSRLMATGMVLDRTGEEFIDVVLDLKAVNVNVL